MVAAVFALAYRTAGRIPAIAAAMLLATLGASPFIESFTLSGELLASLPAVLSLIAFVQYQRGDGMRWLVACGLLTGCAVLMKQSGFDGGLAAVAFLLLCRRRAGIVPAAVVVGCALVPVAVAAITAPSFHDWWYAMVTYRGQGDSIVSGSLSARFSQFRDTLPEVLRALAPLAALTIYGWRRSPVLLRLWLGAAALGVVGGGNFHAHYYIQLAAPLAVLGGVGAARLWETRSGLVAGVACGLALWSAVAIVPLWFDSPSAQAAHVFPNDEHLQHDAAVIAYVRGHTDARAAHLRDVGGRERLLPGRPRAGRALHVVPPAAGDPGRLGRGALGAGRARSPAAGGGRTAGGRARHER